jgi:hypothetical protein
MKATCGHLEEKSFTNANDGLCRKCHSNFAFLLELEAKYGEDALALLIIGIRHDLSLGQTRKGRNIH